MDRYKQFSFYSTGSALEEKTGKKKKSLHDQLQVSPETGVKLNEPLAHSFIFYMNFSVGSNFRAYNQRLATNIPTPQ